MSHYPFVNPPLPYAYDALEPFIDTKTMHLHIMTGICKHM